MGYFGGSERGFQCIPKYVLYILIAKERNNTNQSIC